MIFDNTERMRFEQEEDGRQVFASYRLRDGVDSIPALNLVAIEHDEHGREVVVGTIRYWPILVGGTTRSILLGPIAVAAHLQGSGLGSKMIRMSLNKAVALGHKSVILVGDAPYYERFGFSRALTLGMEMPGLVDMSRLLGLELVPHRVVVRDLAGPAVFGVLVLGVAPDHVVDPGRGGPAYPECGDDQDGVAGELRRAVEQFHQCSWPQVMHGPSVPSGWKVARRMRA